MGRSFVAEGDDRIETGRLAGRPDPEHDPDGKAEKDGYKRGDRIEDEAPAGERPDQGREGHPKHDSDEAAEERQDEGLDQELGEDVPTTRPDRLADPDLTGRSPRRGSRGGSRAGS